MQIYKSKDFHKILEIRDKKSKINNLPKNWVLSDEEIIAMIKRKKFDAIKKNKFFLKKEKGKIIIFLKKIFKIRIRKLNDKIKIKTLEFFRYLVSNKYSIDVNLIASKYDLIDYKNIKNKSKWRKKIFFDLYEKIVTGKKKFILNNFKP